MDSTYQPLARPIFIYVNAQKAKEEYIHTFVEFYLQNAAPLVEEVGYIPLQSETYESALYRFNRGIRGSVFTGGVQVGVPMANLLRMQN